VKSGERRGYKICCSSDTARNTGLVKQLLTTNNYNR